MAGRTLAVEAQAGPPCLPSAGLCVRPIGGPWIPRASVAPYLYNFERCPRLIRHAFLSPAATYSTCPGRAQIPGPVPDSLRPCPMCRTNGGRDASRLMTIHSPWPSRASCTLDRALLRAVLSFGFVRSPPSRAGAGRSSSAALGGEARVLLIGAGGLEWELAGSAHNQTSQYQVFSSSLLRVATRTCAVRLST